MSIRVPHLGTSSTPDDGGDVLLTARRRRGIRRCALRDGGAGIPDVRRRPNLSTPTVEGFILEFRNSVWSEHAAARRETASARKHMIAVSHFIADDQEALRVLGGRAGGDDRMLDAERAGVRKRLRTYGAEYKVLNAHLSDREHEMWDRFGRFHALCLGSIELYADHLLRSHPSAAMFPGTFRRLGRASLAETIRELSVGGSWPTLIGRDGEGRPAFPLLPAPDDESKDDEDERG